MSASKYIPGFVCACVYFMTDGRLAGRTVQACLAGFWACEATFAYLGAEIPADETERQRVRVTPFNDHLVVLPPSSDKSIGETILNITVLLQSSPSSIEIITTGPQVAFSLLSLFRHIGIIPLLNTDK